MANIPAIIEVQKNDIILGLSITTPTGKVRVKRKNETISFGFPIATKQTIIDNNCFIEWQIGYDTPYKETEGVVVPEITFYRKGELKYGYELTSILWLGLKNKIFKKKYIDELIDYAQDVSQNDFIQENSNISRNILSKKNFSGLCFDLIEEKYPVFFLNKEDYQIDIIVKYKQIAVGYQSMVYVWLPLKNSIENIIGRNAKSKEIVHFKINQGVNNFIFDTIKSFSIASKQHNEDMKNILGQIKKLL